MSIEINCLKVAAFSFGSRIHAVVAVFEQLAVKTNLGISVYDEIANNEWTLIIFPTFFKTSCWPGWIEAAAPVKTQSSFMQNSIKI